MNILIDEDTSPYLAARLHRQGVPAEAVAHIGLSEAEDVAVWAHALATDAIVVTRNFRDFLALAAHSEVHPGLITLRVSGLTRQEQWAHLEPAIAYCLSEEEAGRSLINRVVEILGVGRLDAYELPAA